MGNRSIKLQASFWVLLLTIGVMVSHVSEAQGENPAEFYKGKTIQWIVSSGAGSTTDLLSRVAAAHLGKEIGAKVKVENMGRNKGLNYAFTRSKPDGLTLVSKSRTAMLLNDLAGAPGVKYKSAEFNYITDLMVSAGRALFVRQGSPYTTIESLRKAKGLKAGGTSARGIIVAGAAILFEIIGLDGRVIPGYKSPPKLFLALEQDEINLMVFQAAAGLRRVKEGSVKAVFVLGKERFAELPDVPTLEELGVTIPAEWGDAYTLAGLSGQAVAAPPGVPEERLRFLRETFQKFGNKKEIRKEIENIVGFWSPFEPGEKMQAAILEIMSNKALRDQLKTVVAKYSVAAR